MCKYPTPHFRLVHSLAFPKTCAAHSLRATFQALAPLERNLCVAWAMGIDGGGIRLVSHVSRKSRKNPNGGCIYIHGIQMFLSTYMHNTYIMIYHLCIILYLSYTFGWRYLLTITFLPKPPILSCCQNNTSVPLREKTTVKPKTTTPVSTAELLLPQHNLQRSPVQTQTPPAAVETHSRNPTPGGNEKITQGSHEEKLPPTWKATNWLHGFDVKPWSSLVPRPAHRLGRQYKLSILNAWVFWRNMACFFSFQDLLERKTLKSHFGWDFDLTILAKVAVCEE